MTKNDDRIAALEARLDRQADAIRALRKQVRTLTGASPSTAEVGLPLTTWSPPPACVMCGGDKSGRKTLTCAKCSAERNAIIKNGLDRTPILRDSCASCGTGFARSARFLCIKCSAEFKLWKSDQ